MKRSLIIILVLALFAPLCTIEAKDKGKKMDRKEWFAHMRQHKHDFIAKELGLAKDQQTKFFPIYDAMEDEIFKVNRETRKLEKQVANNKAATDVEYDAATKAIIDLKKKESAIELKYFDKLKTVISSKQLFILKKAERKFTHNIMKEHNKKCSKKK